MAKKEEERALARLIPSKVVNVDGHDVMVPNGEAENAMANKLLASQMRNMIQGQIKKYKDGDIRLTPKEMKDLAEAARTIAEFSGEVYRPTAKDPDEPPKPATPAGGSEDGTIDLDAITITPPKDQQPDK